MKRRNLFEEANAEKCGHSLLSLSLSLPYFFDTTDKLTRNNPNESFEDTGGMRVDVTYADDTLWAGKDIVKLATYLHCLIDIAKKFGSEPNWDKTLHIFFLRAPIEAVLQVSPCSLSKTKSNIEQTEHAMDINTKG